MHISRREFLGITGALTGLAAIVRTSPASAFEYNVDGFNSLIPNYGMEHFEPGRSKPLGRVGNMPNYVRAFKIPDGRLVQEVYVGPDRYAISVSEGEGLKSFTLYDDSGDGKFRRKYYPFETIEIPNWILRRYLPKSKT